MGLVAPTFVHEPIPTPSDNHISSTVIDRLHRNLGHPFGDHDSQTAITLETGALEVFGQGTIDPLASRDLKQAAIGLSWMLMKRRVVYFGCGPTQRE